MKKNDILNLEILDNGMDFEGIAKYDNKVIFVPGAISGEKVKVRILKDNKNYAFSKLENIIKKSPFRKTPFCDVYDKCGGCSAQHIEYTKQLNMKESLVKSVLKKENVEYEKLNSIIGMGLPFYYRNKVQYPIRINKEGKTVMGFYSKRTHRVIENTCCYIQERVIDILAKQIFEKILEFNFSGYNEDTNKGDIRHLLLRRGYHTGEIMIILVLNDRDLINDNKFLKFINEIYKISENIKGIFVNINNSKTNEILGQETVKLVGKDYISDYLGEYKYLIGPKTFFQVNTLQAEVLYNVLKENLNLNGSEILFDLYSGVGSIGIFLSESVKEVYGIEIEESSVDMAKLNLIENNVNNAEYIAGSVEQKIEEFNIRNIKPDVIVVDPPRKGLDDKSIQYILDFKPKKIGYVSCNPATMARDLKKLEKNYNIISINPVDMFAHTSNVECVALMGRKDNESE